MTGTRTTSRGGRSTRSSSAPALSCLSSRHSPPANGLSGRVADIVAAQLRLLGVDEDVVEADRDAMHDVRVAPTADRSVVGMMNEFVSMAGHRRDRDGDLTATSTHLAHTPCGPLYKSHTYPDRELNPFSRPGRSNLDRCGRPGDDEKIQLSWAVPQGARTGHDALRPTAGAAEFRA